MNINKQILELRNKGYGYKKIASELQLTRDQVRYICKRSEGETSEDVCKNCGIKIKSSVGKKRKIYCSDKCRYQWWNDKRKVKQEYDED
jgi:orotate phosphoribosyltransferase-like protein